MIRRLGQIVMAWTVFASLMTGFLLYRTSDVLTRTVRTDAHVERFAEEGNRSAPVFRFRDMRGEQVEATFRAPAGSGDWQIGQHTGVLFDPDNPQNVIPDEPLVLFRLPALAALATLLPLFVYWLMRLFTGRGAPRGS